MSRKWQKYREFPLDKNLGEINSFMRSQSIAYLYTNTVSKQELWLPEKEDKTVLDDFLDKYFRGELGFHRNEALNSSRMINFFDELIYCPISSYIVILSLVGYVATDVFKSDGLFKIFSFVPPFESFIALQPWRSVSPSFLHFGLIHFLLSAGIFWWVGKKVELFLGNSKFLFLFFVSSLLGNWFQFLVVGTTLYGGLTGAFFGLLGFSLTNQILFKNNLLKLDQSVYIVAVILLLTGITGFLDWILTGGFAAWSNWAGLVTGMTFATFHYLSYER